jgi:hypothetical protein
MWCEVIRYPIVETIFHRQSGTLAFQEFLGYLTEEETAKACVQGRLSNKSHSIGLYGRAVLHVRRSHNFGRRSFPFAPDLSPLDFFMRGYTKGNAYSNNPRTQDKLKNGVSEIIAIITPQQSPQT